MSDVLLLGNGLLSTIAKAIELWNQRNQNVAVLEELKQFVKDLEENIRELQKKAIGCSNSTAWALDALQKDLENADLDAKNILNKGFIRSVWNSNKTQSKIQALREHVMTSFQSRLLFVTLDVVIEGKQEQDAFQEAMLNVNTKLMDLYSSNSGSIKKSVQEVLRKELKQVLQPVMVALKSHGERIENAMLTIRKTEPQTSEAEKFFADVLAGLEGISKEIKEEGSSSKGNANKGCGGQSLKWYLDPITWEKMCDPVKATDGHTYDRWTILRNPSGMARSPFIPGDQRPFHIATDDIDVRSRLFHKFPEQEEKFTAERCAYRDAALQAAAVGDLGESLTMLDHVLQWAPHDTVCRNKRDQVHLLIVGGAMAGNNVMGSCELFVQNMEAGRSFTEQITEVHDSDFAASMTVCRGGLDLHEDFGETRPISERDDYADLYGSDLPSSSDESEEEKTGTRLDGATVNPREVALSEDGLQATYKRGETRNATGVVLYANLPCPSDCYPFYYFEMEVSKDDMQHAHVGIGFSSTKGIGQNSSVVDSAHPDSLCGYEAAAPGAVPVLNLDGEDGCLVSVARGRFRGGDTVGAGFHTSTRNVFFTHNGQVVALLKSKLGNVRFHLVFPVVVLQNYGAQVKLNFGHGCRGFLGEPLPTRLERTTCDPNVLYVSRNGLSLRLMARADGGTRRSGIGAIMADKPVPVRTALFYFEITVADAGDNGLVGLGFTGKSSFCKDEMPGWYNNSCAYHGGDGKLYQADRGEGTPFGSVAVAGDTMGAGIHHGNNEIFFVKNGVLIATVSNTLTGVVTPVVGLGSLNGHVRVDFSAINFHAEARPSRLVVSPSSSKLVDLTPDGLTACYVGQRRPRAQDGPELNPVAAVQADHVACFHSCDNYYFELKVVNSGERGRIAIGFTHQNHFQADKQPGWYPNSCGYHGENGMLYFGAGLIGEKFGPTFSDGDTVGAGIDNDAHVIFFVKNGKLVGQHQMQMSCALRPIIGLRSANEKVSLNFGQDLFCFDSSGLRLRTI